MDTITKFVERSVKLFIKAYLLLVLLCVTLKIVSCWMASIHLTLLQRVELWGALLILCVVSYAVWRHRRPKPVRKTARSGAERVPLMPHSGGEA